MITIRINGGLGNQMFQYATAKYLTFKCNTEVFLDIDEFNVYKLRKFELDKYNLEYAIIKEKNVSSQKVLNPNSSFIKILKIFRLEKLVKNYYFERNLLFDKKVLKLSDGNYLEGFFQCEKYFYNIRQVLLKEFTLKEELSEYSRNIKEKLEKKNKNKKVSLHIRRGDYISNNTTNIVHGLCDIDYYNNAISYLNNKLEIFDIYVFSDDLLWAKENLQYKNIYFIENETKRPAHEDIYLMSLCDCNIIANSSFSWWGAWLNQNKEKIVIAPKKWFSDSKMQEESENIVPEKWVKL
jgi:hypothetical protein